MDFLSELNPQQREAVTSGLGQTLVLAGPGSGKTRVLTFRIAYLIGWMGVRPYNILAVTFTNKAAREMEQRVSVLLSDHKQGITLGTFHSTCARILRRETDLLPLKSNFAIFDADDQHSVVKRAVKDLELNEKMYRPESVHAAISRAKNDLRFPKDFPVANYRDEVVKRVYQRYQDLLVASNAVDFDDLLLYTAWLLEENQAVRERWARRFEHILVDEFQDTNEAQYKIVRHLASYHGNLFVVGDEDQSIYRWRGADYRNMQRFEEDYPKARKILLEQNYRSTQNVLDAARAVIDRNLYRTPKRLHSDRGEGEKLSLYEASDDYAEAAYVVDTIATIVASRRARGSDFAVMYRTNAQSRLLEESFLRAGLPYRLVGAQRFYGRREIKDLIAYLRLVHNPEDEVSLARVINTPTRGIGDKTVATLLVRAQQAGTGAGMVVMDLARGEASPYWADFKGRAANLLSEFGALLAGWYDSRNDLNLPDLFNRIVEEVRYRDYIDDGSEEGQDRWGNVEELRRIVYEYQDRGMVDFLENMALVSDQDTLDRQPETRDAPTLLTLHAAKGLEFDQVFLLGLDDGLLPHSRALEDPEEMAEERRLLYVGLTRAKNKLYLVRAEQRNTYGSFQETIPSRFLRDIPEELIESKTRRTNRRDDSRWESSRGRRSYSEQASSGSNTWGGTYAVSSSRAPKPASVPIVEQRYHPNMRVNHPVWGEGLVADSRIEGGDETVDIFFDSVGFKRLVASLAKLDILKEG